MGNMIRKYFRAFINSVWLSVVFFITLETCARIDDKILYDAPIFANYSYERLIKNDEEGIRINVPNSQFEKWKINSQGFRGPEIIKNKDKHTMRIICMGASETFGLYENLNNEWPAQLQKLFENNNCSVQIINTSVAGLFLNDFKTYIRKYVLNIKPDIIILHVNPFIYIKQKKNPPERKLHLTESTNQSMTIETIKHLSPGLRILPKIKQLTQRTIPKKILTIYQTWDMGRQVDKLEKQNRLLGIEPKDNVNLENIDRLKTDLTNLVKYLSEMNIPVVLSSYPVLLTRENISQYIHIFLDARRFSVELTLAGMIDASEKFNRAIRNVAEITGSGFVDNDATIPKNINYFGDNVHYTDDGAMIIALNYYQHLINSTLLNKYCHWTCATSYKKLVSDLKLF